jgi:hypothetical protein
MLATQKVVAAQPFTGVAVRAQLINELKSVLATTTEGTWVNHVRGIRGK